MCAACAVAAAAGASGARSWLAARHATWLTPRRMRAATAVLLASAGLVSSVGLSGSTAGKAPAKAPTHAQRH
jgi:hypothetical protein